MKKDKKAPSVFECIILGGGLVGTTAALKAARCGLNVVLVESRDFSKRAHYPRDMRTTAISHASMTFLEEIGVWERLKDHACPIGSIRTFEHDAAPSLNFMKDDRHRTRFNHPLGFMVDNAILREVLEDVLIEESHKGTLTFVDKDEAKSFHQSDARVDIECDSGKILRGRLVINAEGRHSKSRAMFGIQAKTKSYNQTALVAMVSHEESHAQTAFEMFHPRGPIAFLPFHNGAEGKPRSAIVWSSKDALDGLPHQELETRINTLFTCLGKVSILTEPTHYPLVKQTVSSQIAQRFVLVGDAAHVMHPVAGQGVNLGWQDVAVLMAKLVKHRSLGLDIGSHTLLEAYQKSRKRDQLMMLGVTDRLIDLFGIDQPTVKMLRTMGLGVVDRIPPLKNLLMRKAMGY